MHLISHSGGQLTLHPAGGPGATEPLTCRFICQIFTSGYLVHWKASWLQPVLRSYTSLAPSSRHHRSAPSS